MDSYRLPNQQQFSEQPFNKTPMFYTNAANSPYISVVNNGNLIDSTVIPIVKSLKVKTTDINNLKILHGLNSNYFEIHGRVFDMDKNLYFPIPYYKNDGGGTLGSIHSINIYYDTKQITFTEVNTLGSDKCEVQLYFLKFYV